MSKRFLEYEYTETDGNQYGFFDYQNHIGVDAVYVKSDLDSGNPFIEALPAPRTKKELNVACQKGIPGYDHAKELSRSRSEKILSILRLRDIRFPLPFNYILEDECFQALILSYRTRHMFRDAEGDINVEYETKNTTRHSDGILIGNDAAATSGGFTLIGYSGCGKSSALETLFQNYPQCIIHHGNGLTTYPQIVYLVVQCPPHSNFRGLYKNIGVAIDRALGNIKPVYAKELDAGERGNLALYTDRVRICIEKFSIGIIIFDEIQHLNFDSTMENSFESILELANQTKVAFAVVGTEDSYTKIFTGNLRQARRLGSEIHADKYCDNRKIFDQIVLRLFDYQWFDTFVKPDKEIIDALYKYTRGIIDQLIGIYMYMNIDAVRSEKNITVNADFVKKTAERHYPGIANLLRDLKNPESERIRTDLVNKANQQMAEIANEEKEKSAEEDALQALSNTDIIQVTSMKQYVVSRIGELHEDYTPQQIEAAFNNTILTTEGKAAIHDNVAMIRLVFKALSGETTKKTTSAQKTKQKKKARPEPDTVIKSLLDGSQNSD